MGGGAIERLWRDGVEEGGSRGGRSFIEMAITGPILAVMQYEADPWTGLSKLIAPVLVGKIQVISLVPN